MLYSLEQNARTNGPSPGTTKLLILLNVANNSYFISSPIQQVEALLAHPATDAPLRLQTDATDSAIGAVLEE